jgi:exodeoxyribonuclease V beta subunit
MIYTVALHRLLKARLPNYEPENHLGGVYYVFLRAMGDGEGVFFKQLSLSELEQLDALFLQGAA